MRKSKKGMFAFVIALIMTVALAIPAFANDHQDRRYSFIFSRNEDRTDFFYKEDASPVYVTCKSASHLWYAHVMGGPPETDQITTFARVPMNTGTTKFVNVYYNSSWVYGMRGEATYWDSAAWGYWSPDSV